MNDIKLFRQVNAPYKIGMYPRKEWESYRNRFVKWCTEHGKPAFEAIYWATKEDWSQEDVVVDRIKIEIDSTNHGLLDDECLARIRNVISFIHSQGWKCYVNFTGNSGVAITLKFVPVDLKHKYETVTRFTSVLNTKVNNLLDDNAIKGTRQLMRIVNSVNQKTGLYAIPLHIQEIYESNASQILTLASNARWIPGWGECTETDINDNFMIPILLQKLDEKVESNLLENNFQYDVKRMRRKSMLKPCIIDMIMTGKSSWDILSAVGMSMVNRGYTDKEIHSALQYMSIVGDKFVYNQKRASLEITKIRNRKLREPSCMNLQRKGLCSNPNHYGEEWYFWRNL